MVALAAHPALGAFLRWVADKPVDFHPPTRRSKGRGQLNSPSPRT